MLVVLVVIANAWVAFMSPESPDFLLETQQFEALEHCLIRISKANGFYSQVKIKTIMEALRLNSEREIFHDLEEDAFQNASHKTSIFHDSTNRRNLFAACVLWSMSGFINYLIMYYSKYFGGSFYLNYSFLGFAD